MFQLQKKSAEMVKGILTEMLNDRSYMDRSFDLSPKFIANPIVSSRGNLDRGELTDEEAIFQLRVVSERGERSWRPVSADRLAQTSGTSVSLIGRHVAVAQGPQAA